MAELSFFFSSRRRHTRYWRDWSSDVCSSDLTWVPAMVPWRATENGDVTEEVIAWYERFAAGRPGAIVVEATGVRDVPSGPRSEERRVGKECRSRWSAYH